MSNEFMVSVVMPAYNCGGFIAESIASVQAQTHTNWELLVADDCSTDNTTQVVEAISAADPRVKYLRLEKNSGAAAARNLAIENAAGRYIAFLDSDDLWYPQKLEKQLDFMQKKGSAFSCTAYDCIKENGEKTSRKVVPFKKADYNLCLFYGCCIGNSTAMYDCEKHGKFFVPPIRKRNDFALWLQVLKKEKYVHGLQEVLASYRNRKESLSKNKLGLFKYHWQLYREIEGMNVFKSLLAMGTLLVIKSLKLLRR